MVSIVEPLVADSAENLSLVESELLSVTLQRYNDSIASDLTRSCGEMVLLIRAVKSQRCTANSDQTVASAAIMQVKKIQLIFRF